MTSVVNRNVFSHYELVVSDTAYAGGPADALYVGVGGVVRLIRPDNTEISMTVIAGVLPLRSIRVEATGTTATGLVALYTRKKPS